LEPQEAHLTGEFVVAMKNGGCALLRLVAMLANVVNKAILSFSIFLKKILFLATSKQFRVFKISWKILFFKGDFHCKVCL